MKHLIGREASRVGLIARREGVLNIALVIPLQGPAGLFGPSCEACAQLAVEEANASDGVLGREVRLIVVDGGQAPSRVADEVETLIDAGAVDAVTGWHISAVREVLAPRIDARIPYVYTALYEGGEHRPGVFLTGETPNRQLWPSLRWFDRNVGIRRWAIVGNDYVWPRMSALSAKTFLREEGGIVCDEMFVPLGTTDFGSVLRRIENSQCDGVLMLLIGDDAVAFNREFVATGLDRDLIRFSSLIDENVLLASGSENTRGLMTAAGFFDDLPTASGLDFAAQYSQRFGSDAPVLNSLGESCYEGIRMIVELMRRAGSSRTDPICAIAEGTTYESPRGTVEVRAGHLKQSVFLAAADGLQWDVLHELQS